MNTRECIIRDEMVVYLDVYFGLNLWMNVILIGITAAVCRERIKAWRMVAAACIGAAVACVLLTARRGIKIFGIMSCAFIMIRVVFPHMRWKALIRAVGVYIVISIFVGGVINWWYFEMLSGEICAWKVGVLGAGVAVVCMSGIWMRRRQRRRERDTYRVLLRIHGRDIITAGFLDTGNCLRDEKGRPVHICEKEFIGKDTGIGESFNVTYNTLSGEGSMEVVCAERLLVPELGVDEKGALIGLTEERLFADERCHILLNSVLGEER